MNIQPDPRDEQSGNNIRFTEGALLPLPPSAEELEGLQGAQAVERYTDRVLRWARKTLGAIGQSLDSQHRNLDEMNALLRSFTETPHSTNESAHATLGSWLSAMKVINPLAHAYENAVEEGRKRFGSIRLTIVPADYRFIEGDNLFRPASVPTLISSPTAHQLATPRSETLTDPLTAMCEGTPLSFSSLTTREFRALITVPDYRNDSLRAANDAAFIEFGYHGYDNPRLPVPEGHFVLGLLHQDTIDGKLSLELGDGCGYRLQKDAHSRIISDEKINGALIAESLNRQFEASGLPTLSAKKDRVFRRITIEQSAEKEPLPHPYAILALCLNAIAEAGTAPPSAKKSGPFPWPLRRPGPSMVTADEVERAPILDISEEVDRLRDQHKLAILFQKLAVFGDVCSSFPLYNSPLLRRAVGAALPTDEDRRSPSYLSFEAGLWLFRTLTLLREETEKPLPFFTSDRTFGAIDRAFPFNPHNEGQPFRDFLEIVNDIRIARYHLSEKQDDRAALAQIAIEGIREAFTKPEGPAAS